MNTKKKFSFRKAIKYISVSLVSLVVLWVASHQIMVLFEKNKYEATGQLVEVGGNSLHVHVEGEGPNTIILLPGLGTSAPVLDFEPLMNELSKSNRVVVVEPFGYGWSEKTEKDRTVENMVEEVRTALKEASIEGPYILMPHSIGGIYSMYYANTYPEEVEAIVGIDPTLPAAVDYFDVPVPTMPGFLRAVAPSGIARIVIAGNEEDFLPLAAEGTYSTENLELTKTLTVWNGYNKNIIMEPNEISNNIAKTINMSFPADIPVMIFTPKEEKTNPAGKSTITFYKEQLENVEKNKIVPLEGHHYLHWTNAEEMSKHVGEFISGS
ncbi:alpha/beta fold hydrolase [Sutcliffiella horikoshii]|uniref:Alpha/beta hydrolase n=1 Tax=Sutcliffiella horikoshii TaxID=79883 RepID=A0A5D4T067_9BACI|nr:alpha/beta hydrolase [Sutcliffiella horikoshii]TYS67988.1 alpha/beta hydrolase [Sutcliffiella horikoshii]